MDNLATLLRTQGVSAPLNGGSAIPHELQALLGATVYTHSVVAADGTVYCLARRNAEKVLCVLSEHPIEDFDGEDQTTTLSGARCRMKICPTDAANAAALRRHLAFCNPMPACVRPTMGCGDRLGLATPAHIQGVRGTGVFPVLAQQSIREMERTGRTPQQVMDSAVWGVFQEGWRGDFGSDADHLKTTEHIDRCLAAGFTMFTVDPGDHVDNAAEGEAPQALEAKYAALPFDELDITPEQWRTQYVGHAFDLGDNVTVRFDERGLLQAAVKYGRAVLHTAKMYRHLKSAAAGRPFELEMSVDETDSPTSPAEHYFVASELKRLGVEWTSLAPRFVGEFEKGVDYRGCLAEFKQALEQHVRIAQRFGPYKISLHSGSDKFSVYPILSQVAGEMVHLKTAGTSYLEALRAVARTDSALFRDILSFARDRYPADRATYHVSGEVDQVPGPDTLKDAELSGLLDQDPARQVLHVTYGSVLTAEDDGRSRFKDRLIHTLQQNEKTHEKIVSAHVRRHAEPIARHEYA